MNKDEFSLIRDSIAPAICASQRAISPVTARRSQTVLEQTGAMLARAFGRRRRRWWGFLDRLLLCLLRFGSRFRSCCRFPIRLDQTAHRIGWLCALADPVFDSIDVQRTIMIGFLWVVRANRFDKFSIARTALIGHYHFVVGAILRSLSA